MKRQSAWLTIFISIILSLGVSTFGGALSKGLWQTTNDTMRIGGPSSDDVKVIATTGSGSSDPALRVNKTTKVWQFANDGTSFVNLADTTNSVQITGTQSVAGSKTFSDTATGTVISKFATGTQAADASNQGIVTTGTQTFAGEKTFNGLAYFGAGITGRTDGASACAGCIGEYKVSQQSTFTNTAANNVWGDGASLVLTSGSWVVSSFITFTLNSATMSYVNTGISTTSGNSSAGLSQSLNWSSGAPPTANNDSVLTIPTYQVNVASSTTYYLKIRVGFSAGSPQWAGTIQAVRIY